MFQKFAALVSILSLAACTTPSVDSQNSPTQAAVVTTTTHSVITTTTLASQTATDKYIKIADYCEKSLSAFPGKHDAKALKKACESVQILTGCESVQGSPIYHYNQNGDAKKPANILVFSLIHGDETPAGSVGRFWMERLQGIVPRNNWRVVPVLNPDGVAKKTRTNANAVDVNRNFPTADWAEKAQAYWKRDSKSNPRRFPGHSANSEPETACALKHIEDFKPDFIVSIHTPLKVLDFDGPKVKPPQIRLSSLEISWSLSRKLRSLYVV